MKIDKLNFEKLAIKNWTSFFDPRQMFSYLATIAAGYLNEQGKITSLRITRFEPTLEGIIIWIEYNIQNKTTSVNATSEFLLIGDELKHITSVK